MFRRRRSPPVLAEISAEPGGRKPGSLNRTELEALAGLLKAVGEARAVQMTGDEGKSAVALGLATAAIVDARRAVLLECDLERPTLAATLGLADAPGFGEYLRCEAEAREILQPLVPAGPASEGATEPLVCIVAGARTSHGPALLASDHFRHAIARLRSAYDLVVVDGPPAHAEHSLMAATAEVDMTLACCSRPDVSKRLRDHVDGLVIVS
jgi:Mrp family chromosome partitioning ATPase